MARKKYSVGVIGLGFGRAHIPAFQANGCDVVAVCQRNQETARTVAARYNVPAIFDRWEQMLEDAKPDIVVIASPPHLHREIALRALEQGAHVLCEKPLAMTAAEGRDMVEAARRAQRVAMTSFNWRFIPAMLRFHALVEEGAVGRLFHAAGRWLGARGADESTPVTWRMDRAQAGHGAMGDQGVHVIDLIRWHFGEFARVTAQAGVAHPTRAVLDGGRPADAEDFCSVLGELASGGQVTFTVSRAARGANEAFLEAYGSQGALVYRLDREKPKWYVGDLRAAGASGTLQPVHVTAGLPRSAGEGDQMEVVGKTTIAPLVKRLLEGIRKGESPSPSLEDGLRAQLVLDAVGRSLADGGWQRVEPA
jgi:predicted dehydrogenase